jgi:hypothetical protein
VSNRTNKKALSGKSEAKEGNHPTPSTISYAIVAAKAKPY